MTAEHELPPRRLAWFVFGVLVLLMIVDYIDRQVDRLDVSAPEGRVGPD